MALHSALGFGVSVLGPLFVGFALDAAQYFGGGAQTVLSWGLGLAVMGLGALIGPWALLRTRKNIGPMA